MINRIFRLVDAKRVEMVQREMKFTQESVLVRPEYMSICAADRRYYFGNRKKEILQQKLPMALIHESTGVVLHDFSGKLSTGVKVVLVPLETVECHSCVKDNYKSGNRFLSSNADGFMQDVFLTIHDRLVPTPDDYSNIYVFSELISVAINALEAFEKACKTDKKAFGVWGDGTMGFIISLVLKCYYPDAVVYVFGKNPRKLQRFSFADQTHYIDRIPESMHIDHCFECVGNSASEAAIAQMIDLIAPQGCINLLGVSEEPISVNTRSLLEKGLQLIGNSRSDIRDFYKAVTLIHDNSLCKRYLQMLISDEISIKNETDISHAFEQDLLNDFKTIIKWEI